MKPKPCRHTRWVRTKLVAYENLADDGSPAPDHPRRKYRVLECLRCVKCDADGNRWTRFYGQTERAALKSAGVPAPELPAPPNHKPKATVESALTCWPFPCSTWLHDYPRPPTKETTNAR